LQNSFIVPQTPEPSLPEAAPMGGGQMGGGQAGPPGFNPGTAGAGGPATVTACRADSKLVDVCIDSAMTIFTNPRRLFPPDPMGAAGLSLLIAVTNNQIEGLRKNGTSLFGPTPLVDMFSGLAPHTLFDPKIIYDAHENRFVVVVLDAFFDQFDSPLRARILVAVSKGDDPQGTADDNWHFLQISGFGAGAFADYPGIAVDEEAIYITANIFIPGFFGPFFDKPLVWIIAKEPFYSGGDASVDVYDFSAGYSPSFFFTAMPATVREPDGIAPGVGTYLVSYNGVTGAFDGDQYVVVVQVNDPLSGNATFQVDVVNVGKIESGLTELLSDGPQKDPRNRGILVETGDRRALQAVWAGGALWMTTTVSDGTETAALWLKLRADGVDFPPAFLDSGKISGEDIASGAFTSFASLDVNSQGVAAFGFAAFASSIYPSAYATMRDDGLDPPGTVRVAELVRAGEGPYYLDGEEYRNRWGDYTGMSLDPANASCFWAFNEYAGAQTFTTDLGSFGPQFGSWKTAWARLCYSGPTCQAINARCSDSTQCCFPQNKVCEGPPGEPRRCNACKQLRQKCARSTECCGSGSPAGAVCLLSPAGTRGPAATCRACRTLGQRCSRGAECCNPDKRFCGAGPPGRPRTCRGCKGIGKPCATVAQCCDRADKVCEGPRNKPKTCKVCVKSFKACRRTSECCPGNTCNEEDNICEPL
jgi:hypothetical protein